MSIIESGTSHLLDRILQQVQKPSRYTGGEWNSIYKEWERTDVKVAFAFPDVYEVGMSHLGLQILYHTINQRTDSLLERVFAPWQDMEQQMRVHGMSLFALESRRPLSDFDMVAFTLQYEMSFTNILNMLDLASIPLRSEDRGDQYPLVIAGGPCAFNPEPMADFIDAFAIGEGEDVFHDIIDVYKANRQQERNTLLRKLAEIKGVYVPALYQVQYLENGKIHSVHPLVEGIPEKISKRVVTRFDLTDFPLRPIVPSMGVVHDRIMLEIMRGCTRGCRFCQAGSIYRPVREKSPETLIKQAHQLVKNTGHDEVSLVSLSSADYNALKPLVQGLLDKLECQGVGISLPSLRVDAFSVDLAKEVQRVRRSSLTFAPEAGTQRLRDVINKGVTEGDLAGAVSSAFSAGWQAVKLYFMMGLPTETQEDLDGIIKLARLVLKKGEEAGVNRGRLKVTVSVSSFVPKSHTPFQWEPLNTREEISEKQNYLKPLLKKDKRISFKWHDPEVSFLEAVLARGDRRLSSVLERVWQLGSRFDGWSECFQLQNWQKAFENTGIDPQWYAYQQYEYDDILPWDHIDAGLSKDYFIREHKRAMKALTTPDCRGGRCPACGVCSDLKAMPEMMHTGGDDHAPLPD